MFNHVNTNIKCLRNSPILCIFSLRKYQLREPVLRQLNNNYHGTPYTRHLSDGVAAILVGENTSGFSILGVDPDHKKNRTHEEAYLACGDFVPASGRTDPVNFFAACTKTH